MAIFKVLGLALVSLVPFWSAPASAMEGPNTQVRLSAAKATISAGETVALAFEFDVQPGWHLYWANPGDTGLAPTVRWAENGAEYTPLAFPTPERFTFAGFTNYGYTQDFTLLTSVTAPSDVSASFPIEASLDWLACDDKVCVPESAKTSITLENVDPAAARSPTADPAIIKGREALPISAQWPAKAAIVDAQALFEIEVPFTSDDVRRVELYPQTSGVINYEAEQKISWPSANVLRIAVTSQTEALSDAVSAVLKVIPKVDGPAQGYAVTFVEAATSDFVAPPATADAATSTAASLGLSVSLPTALLYAFIGGIILNLMPCVFPVLSLKALSFAKSGEDSASAKREGWLYTAGVLISFLALAGGLIAIRAAGSQLGWGFQLQSPVVVAGLSLVMFTIGLNLLGAFEISGGFAGIGQNMLSKQSSGMQAFLTGVLATVVATPCTAPLMATALSFALTQPAPAALAIFFALGFGLALPFLLLAYSTRLRLLLPKPGPWMETFKQLLAFPMFATALWLLWVLSNQGGTEAIMLTLGIALLAGFAVWAFEKGRHARGKAGWAFPIAASGALVIGALGFAQIDYAEKLANAVPTRLDETAFSEDRLTTLVGGEKPVFVYFTADWCITCKANERLALHTTAVKEAFESAGVEILKADWTRRDEDIARVLSRFGRAGVPLYLYYPPHSRAAPRELPQILTPGLLIELVSGQQA